MRRSTLLACLGFSAVLAGCGENLTRDRDPVKPTEPPNLTCVPNLDGRIDSDELQAAIGVPASYLVSPANKEREVDLVGTSDETGAPIWDFSQDFADDQLAVIEATAVGDKWYSESFPEGQFAAPADAAGTIYGVYRHTADALLLLGLASKDEAPKEGKTLLVYDSPVALYRFPLKPGDKWVTQGQVTNGTAFGLPFAGKDTYSVEVGVTGTLELFDYIFEQVHRVKLHVVQDFAVGGSKSTRQSQFLFECFGEVARATSREGESKDDFTRAAEVRRLGQ